MRSPETTWWTIADNVLEVTLDLNSLDDLFIPSAVTPRSSRYMPYSYESGLEYIAFLLYAESRVRQVNATFIAPAEDLAGEDEATIQRAIERFSQAKIEASRIEVRADATRGRRALTLGVVALLALLLCAHRLSTAIGPSFVRTTLITGLQIGAWIALWFPMDKLVWSAWTHRNDRVVYERLAATRFTLVPRTKQGGALGPEVTT